MPVKHRLVYQESICCHSILNYIKIIEETRHKSILQITKRAVMDFESILLDIQKDVLKKILETNPGSQTSSSVSEKKINHAEYTAVKRQINRIQFTD